MEWRKLQRQSVGNGNFPIQNPTFIFFQYVITFSLVFFVDSKLKNLNVTNNAKCKAFGGKVNLLQGTFKLHFL